MDVVTLSLLLSGVGLVSGLIGYKIRVLMNDAEDEEIREYFLSDDEDRKEYTLFLDDGVYEPQSLPKEGEWMTLYGKDAIVKWVLFRPLHQKDGRFTALRRIDVKYDLLNKVPVKSTNSHLKIVR